MKKVFALLFVALVSLNIQAQQQKAEAEHKLIQFQMALLKRGPKWPPQTAAVKAHHDYARSLLASNKAVIFGVIKDDPDLIGAYVLRAKNADEAKEWVMADPAVTEGLVTVEMHPWWSEDVMRPTTTPEKMTTAYLAFLKRGDKWTPEKTAATEELQKAHLANIVRLAELKKLVVAGPFGDDGMLRGIFIFKVGTIDEARELAATDPAVKAGRLALDIHPFVVPEGILP
ncbi:MAG TPA: YciI family protein [Pyrinomonadaceae bacterium]|nr:YciI family protein [Pyrinomonadaceae bacterium]